MHHSPHGFGPMAQPPMRDTSSGGTTVFVYGLLGVVLCQLCAPVAWMKGNEYMRTCRAMGVEPDGLGVAGRVLGIVGTLLMAVSVVFLVVALLVNVLAH
jgi:hypothetical protein